MENCILFLIDKLRSCCSYMLMIMLCWGKNFVFTLLCHVVCYAN
ncbi:putative membrane protein [Candidatus Neoehrlichia lotoris str. RAC413]|uniref:Putative membrane protein n=1 Tax=Candidatus Neoehrlichia procyonis str. RAC413 TaxID=1359163 RepID=A0A0F3NM50_9RICK|nr:putative membrane protein [Candidatus Neoehrlichia lotoris str. RAC413]